MSTPPLISAAAAARLAIVPLVLLALPIFAGCRQPRSKVEPLAPELAQLQARDVRHSSGAEPSSLDAGDAQFIYRRSRTDERARLASVSDALTRLGVLDAQVEQEAAAHP